MKKIIVLPTYNEKDNLERLVKKIFSLEIENLMILIVDDGSPDGTGQLADKLSEEYDIEVIHRKEKLGLGTAYVAGFKKALALGGDIIFEMDADFSHNPDDLPRLIKEIETGSEVVIGSRRIKGGNVEGWSAWRNLQSKAAMSFARFFLGLKTHDITAGFRAFHKSVLKKINLDQIKSNGYAFQEEMIYVCEKNKFKIKEIPVTFIDRELGESKLGMKDIIEFFVTVFNLRFKKK